MSHPPTPEPRPALRKAPDGSVHPASTILSSLSVSLSPRDVGLDGSSTPPGDASSKKQKGRKNGKSKKPAKPEPVELVALQVELPKPVRKALRKRASDYGWTAEEAAAQVLRVWADGPT